MSAEKARTPRILDLTCFPNTHFTRATCDVHLFPLYIYVGEHVFAGVFYINGGRIRKHWFIQTDSRDNTQPSRSKCKIQCHRKSPPLTCSQKDFATLDRPRSSNSQTSMCVISTHPDSLMCTYEASSSLVASLSSLQHLLAGLFMLSAHEKWTVALLSL